MELVLTAVNIYVLSSVYLRGKVICEDECRLLVATGMTGDGRDGRVDSCIF